MFTSTPILKSNATVAIIQRGKNLYNSKQVSNLNATISEDIITIDANVKGLSGKYKCYIEIKNEQILKANCTCPYDWGGLCKHQVAVLFAVEHNHLLVQNTPDNEIKQGNQSKRNVDTAFILPLDKGIDLAEFLGTNLYEEAERVSHQVYALNTSIDLFEFVAKDYSNRSSKSAMVKLRPNENGTTVAIESNGRDQVVKLSVEELAVLIYMRRTRIDHWLQLKNPDYQNQLLKSKGQEYGIDTIDQAKRYFEFDFSQMHSIVRLKPEYQGLMPVRSNFHLREEWLPTTQKQKLAEQSILYSEVSSKEDRTLIYCLNYQLKDNQYKVLSITPIVGKLKQNGEFNRTGFTLFWDLSYFDQFSPTKEQSEIIDACKITQPNEFSIRLGGRLRKFTSVEEKLHYVLSENLKQIREVLNLIHERKESLYTMKGDMLGKITPEMILPTKYNPEPISLELQLTSDEETVHLTPKLSSGPQQLLLTHPELYPVHPLAYVMNGHLGLMKSSYDARFMMVGFKEQKRYSAFIQAFPIFFEKVVAPLTHSFPLNIESLPPGIHLTSNQMKPISKKLFLKELDNFILFRPVIGYDLMDIDLLDDYQPINLKSDTVNLSKRDKEAEQELLETIADLHPKFKLPTHHSFFNLHINEFVEDYWFLKMFQALKDQNIEVFGFNDFKKFNYSPYTPNIQINAKSGIDWFDLEVKVTVGDTNISLKDVRKALLSEDKYIKLGDGKLAILPTEWIKKLERYLRVGKVEKDVIQISKLRFNALDELFNEIDHQEIYAEIANKKEKLSTFQQIQQVPLPKLDATLRHYQEDGYQWLHFLHEFGWGGILADDMGLGKTLQMITFLKSLVDQGLTHHLVVVPTSLLFNWQNEIEKFCPSLTFQIYHGSNRERENPAFDQYDLTLTTYGLLISDIKRFEQFEFGYIVLDESQAIKNPFSKRFKATALLKAKNRLAMTGTPIENNTFDLYAQMAFTNPGLFLSAEHFKKSYAVPIDRYADESVAQELSQMTHPFILRRTKEKVASELPEKTEDVIYCQMESEQRKVYDAYLNQYKNEILGLIEEDALESSKLHVLQALMKLRQICNSPALLNEEANYGNDSIKIKELVRHIQEKTGHHKLLIFSQFVGMLKLIKKELDRLKVPYSYLDGQTPQRKREAEVNSFQQSEDRRVFLISLKAGGTGLNLTAADYVYIVDPWWNPAVENQAIDRCYRIGQDKKVIAYRMICVDTLEEKIMQLKSRKKAVADAIIHTDESIMKNITQEDILHILG